jgi:thiosulfate dehydrogenase (quinone) large subunit
MQEEASKKGMTIFFRIAMGWTFLYAGISQLMQKNFSVAGFALHAKTFHDVFIWFGQPGIAPFLSFLVKWGHTLIGLSLVSGLLVQLSSPFAIFLLMTFYFGHMDWPYIENHSNFIMDYHVVYIAVLVYLVRERAGEVVGLDGWLKNYRARQSSNQKLTGLGHRS